MTAYTDEQALERKQQKAERDRIKTQEIFRAAAVKALYSTNEGRAYLRWILELTGAIGHNPFRGDPNATAFQCGVLSVGQALMAHMLETDPTRFTQLLKEPDHARRTDDAPDDRADLFGDGDENDSGNGDGREEIPYYE